MKIGNSITNKFLRHVCLFEHVKQILPFRLYAKMYIFRDNSMNLHKLVSDSYTI